MVIYPQSHYQIKNCLMGSTLRVFYLVGQRKSQKSNFFNQHHLLFPLSPFRLHMLNLEKYPSLYNQSSNSHSL